MDTGDFRRKTGKIARESKSWDSNIPLPVLTFHKAASLVFLSAILCFMNSWNADFVFDDAEAVLGNKDIKPDTSLEKVFLHDFWGNRLSSNSSHKSYRPLTILTLRLNYYLANGFHPCGFHMTNIALHGVVCVLFLHIMCVLVSASNAPGQNESNGCVPRTALLSSLLFAVHPIHTESVAGVVGRADLLCALIFFLAFLCYHQAFNGLESNKCYPPENFSLLWIIACGTLCGVSVLCKEQGITALGLCSAYDIIILCRINFLHTAWKWKSKLVVENSKCCVKNNEHYKLHSWQRSLLLRQLLLLLMGILILYIRWRIMGSQPPTFQVVDNPHSFVNSTLLRIMNYHYIYSLNAWLLICPYWLCFDWSMGCVPIVSTFSDPRLLALVALWITLGGLLYTVAASKQTRHQRLVSLSLVLLVVPFLPATNLLFRVGFVIAERVLYLSVAGAVLLSTLGINALVARLNKNIIALFMALLLIVFAAKSVKRTNEWRTEKSLFTSAQSICPLNAKVHYNIGKVHGDTGNIDYAIRKYRHAIRLNPDYDQAMNNLANILKERLQFTEAEQLLEKATNLRPDFAAAWMNLGIVQAELQKHSLAENSYYTAIKHRKQYPDCYYNLGNLYLDMKMHAQALTAWRNATLQNPSHLRAWTNMIILLDNLERYDDLDVVSSEALHHNPDDASLQYNYANSLGKAGRYEQAEKYFLKAIKLEPDTATYHANLGVLYHRWGKLNKAEESYHAALSLDPTAENTRVNLELLRKKRKKN